ncbi:uncharacterized protein B0I36DRAFT_291706 [Microdochium trichocladiopsis]|uniref:Chitin-binding type-1 domain-containing protein n=1 Tax=Microdochium trichocladiopsis TaxID=1682393 RepID=A0A9P9BQ66_9PEZI|nr:uncharacterized protein B0I36DRAFT_291706 [Microdochium trichocladiopsis]KAH7029905.1 hypothetical protein B0I36DRAFT_291706 [Microdochium trichocladiopsis]
MVTTGTCGPANGKQCGGNWGTCCNKSGSCGSGTGFCDSASCWSGNCTTGNSTDGTCGAGTGRSQVCNSIWGYCCASSGKCGDGPQFCGTGCQQAYGSCTENTPTPPPPGPGDISPDGTCGTAKGGFVCGGSPFGDCCSSSGFCGNSTDHCRPGSCQPDFGSCTAGDPISVDGLCGGAQRLTCKGSAFGDCCSSGGWCGSTDGHCKAGCQASFGTCTGSNFSADGSCGPDKGSKTCTGSGFGTCCSSAGFGGSMAAHCGSGCRPNFGTCKTGFNVSSDGTCGPEKGSKTCLSPGFGNCCSSAGFCGTTIAHCGSGCRPNFGTCGS